MKPDKKSSIPKNVLYLSLVSLFNDIASEMIYPIVPLFLTSVLNAPVAIVGLIEGVAEATASLLKFISGYWSDKIHKRKVFVVFGYGFGAVSKLLIAVAMGWPFVLFARFIDRMGKGIRTSARDALLLQNTTKNNKGFIFGFHRATDSLGAVIGPLLALFLMTVLNENMRMTFMIAFVPAFIGVILLMIFVKEKNQPPEEVKKRIHISWKEINPHLKLFFIISMIFAVGNSADAFLILRSKELGLTTTFTVLAYVLYNIVQTVVSTPGGQLADKIGARKVFAIGLGIFACVYFAFGLINNPLFVWVLFPIYGIYVAFTDGVSKAYIAEFITERESGTYFGVYQTGTAICQFLASFIGGALWTKFGSHSTFLYGAAMASIALLIFITSAAVMKRKV
ncbi:MFS transporter [Candidatus Roizmanbacteria bacterium CG_4_10_14_0_8_um_filter_39_9]|uniref:MFS transporter n=1 Tax=Candidatus Roizmanbacteria bacterium CG_4_10_14_0_8_um_filter_39_9 TaxID=1974829 RepID=A0A2M7QCX8_9BACT|nr:MAG: MFS transporter [Candidatus Roizmanbacteria bacterium CG_4_10_14_0_8_um_filter_39_9]